MGLFSSSKNTSNVNTRTDVEVQVNPANTITIDSRASADAITSGVTVIGAAFDNLVTDLGSSLRAASGSLGGGVQGAGANLAFALIGASAVVGLAYVRKSKS